MCLECSVQYYYVLRHFIGGVPQRWTCSLVPRIGLLFMIETIAVRTAAAARDFIAVQTEFAERGIGRTRCGTKHLRPRTRQVVVLKKHRV